MALSHALQQKILQKLSPLQMQLMQLLQLPTANLEERIKDELEENPALEEFKEDAQDKEEENFTDDLTSSNEENNEDIDPDGSEDEYNNIDISEYVTEGDDEIADYKLRDEGYGDTEEKQMPFKAGTDLHETLTNQLGMLSLNKRQYAIAEQIIGSIDGAGYLRRENASIVNDLAFRQNIETTEDEVESLIKKVQQFEPAGIGARNLQECLLLQLKRPDAAMAKDTREGLQIAIQILEKHFDEFTKKHYDKIQKSLLISEEQLKSAIQCIVKLSPKPGGNLEEVSKAHQYIVPDFYIYNNGGKLELSLNARNTPDLRVSENFREMLKDYDKNSHKSKQQKEAVLFIKQKIDSAKWFIDMIKQRQHTLYNTMSAIMEHQKEFFLTGDETTLKPMILKDIAEKVKLDISTISRVANSKFVQTEFGTFRLKFFFSEALMTDSGEEVSSHEVKVILNNLVDGEDKQNPLSDDALTEILQGKGYNIARRTVAKYREQLNISVARLRKEI